MQSTDPVVDLIERFLISQAGWLSCSLEKVALVSSRRTTPYGFEWLIHTALAYFLIKEEDRGYIRDVKIGEKNKYTGRKYDLFFKMGRDKIVIELKTTANLDLSFVKGDLKKALPSGAKLYLLVFSYLTNRENRENLSLDGCCLMLDQLICENFRCLLFKKRR